MANEGVGAFAGNIIVGGPLGVDVVSGATLGHIPNPVFAQMSPLAAVQGNSRKSKPDEALTQ